MFDFNQQYCPYLTCLEPERLWILFIVSNLVYLQRFLGMGLILNMTLNCDSYTLYICSVKIIVSSMCTAPTLSL